MREDAVLFGKHNNLVGIVTVPESERLTQCDKAVVFLNAGILHRIGQNRLYVKMARMLSEMGLLCFRFDYSGIGDSVVADTADQQSVRIINETKAALDYLQTTYGVEKFVLAGSCSGARDAVNIATEDDRVVGAIGINIGLKPGLATYLRSKLFDFSAYKRLVSGKVNIGKVSHFIVSKFKKDNTVKKPAVEVDMAKSDSDKIYSRGHYLEMLPQLNERKVDMLFLCSQWDPSLDSMRQILKKTSASLNYPELITSDVIDDADHDFNTIAHQTQLLDKIKTWARERLCGDPQALPELSRTHPYKKLGFLKNI